MFKDIRFIEKTDGTLQNYQLSYNPGYVYPVALIDEQISEILISTDDDGDDYLYSINNTRLLSLNGSVAYGPYQIHIFRGDDFDFMGICKRFEPELTFLRDADEAHKTLEMLRFVRSQ